ncbi:ATP-binding protein [Flavobacteriaceae bacterium S0862]|nr:ATP-binding protein [Flavobacteriaceae bacterium S0862]
MNDKRYQWILYAIVAVIISTIAIQVYWNFKNYQNNKQQLVNDVQSSLDNAVEKYYTNLAKEQTYGFAFRSSLKDSLIGSKSIDSVMHYIDIARSGISVLDSINLEIENGLKLYKGDNVDSFFKSIDENSTLKRKRIRNVLGDSIITRDFEMLTSKVIVSLTSDSLQLRKIDSIFNEEIKLKNLDINFQLDLSFKETHTDSIESKIIDSSDLYTISKSPFLPPHSSLSVGFSNSTKEILKRNLTGILISVLLVLAVISCLFYLLKIIKHQKQIAEVKNDLISNITHEFKTPIATIGVALESIKNFDVINDKEKTQSYLNMSSNQLSKLNLMVEKLLETAALDSESIELNKDTHNIIALIETLINKHKLSTEKEIVFNSELTNLEAKVDLFHFENAINNVLDNAIKYGGEKISIELSKYSNAFVISISDNGNSLTNSSKQKIFEKFYRVPKGNTHDVKGFGIGLYYTKKIIEKHNGAIDLELNNGWTTFKITMPNA